MKNKNSTQLTLNDARFITELLNRINQEFKHMHVKTFMSITEVLAQELDVMLGINSNTKNKASNN